MSCRDLYSDKYNIRFYHIPKNGMTSMLRTLGLKWVDVKNIPNDVKNVTIIRDVYDRFLSSYNETTKVKRKTHLDGKELIRDFPKDKILKIYDNPDLYVDEILENGFWDGHQISQYEYLNSDIHCRNIEDIDIFIPHNELNEKLMGLGINNTVHLKKRPKALVNETYKLFEHRIDDIIKIYNKDKELWDLKS